MSDQKQRGGTQRSIDSASTSTITELQVPAEHVGLADTVRAVPDMFVEGERVVPMDQTPIPYVWVEGSDFDRFEAAAADDPSVERLRLEADTEEGRLYRVEWAEPVSDVFEWLRGNGGATVLECEVGGGTTKWHFKFRFSEEEEMRNFHRYCDQRGIEFELVRTFELTAAKSGQYNLSEKQYETLLTAMEMGYYDIPRTVTMEELADELGVSSGAVSERLRRAQTNLINNSLRIGKPSGVGLPAGDEAGIDEG